MSIDDQRDAMGDIDRKARDKDVRNIMLFIVLPLVFGLMIFSMYLASTPQQIKETQQAEFDLRDKMDCQHILQDMVYRGWNTTKQDNSDPYFAYDLKLHNERGCKP